MNGAYFFDSYAFFEIIDGNPAYRELVKDAAIVTTKMNLMELHYWIFARKGKAAAEKYFKALLPFTQEIPAGIIPRSNEFRYKMKKRKLSYIDCIGYTMAKAWNIPFLTGDKEFKDLENVKFLK